MQPTTEICPLCHHPKPYSREDASRDVYYFNCPRCKAFNITQEVLMLKGVLDKLSSVGHRISGLTRYLAEVQGEPILIATFNIEEHASNPIIPDDVDINKKADYLLQAIRRRTRSFGQAVSINLNLDYPLAFAANADEIRALIGFLNDRGLVTEGMLDFGTGVILVTITADGWKPSNPRAATQGFVAVWFDETGSMDDVIKKTEEAIKEVGYSPMCIRDKHYSETVMDKALSEIRNSRFLIANLTNARNSVYFEAGFAHGLGIDMIYVCDKQQKSSTEFYSKHYKIYFYESAEDLKQQIIQAIRARAI